MQGIQQFPDFIRALPQIELPVTGAQGWLIQGERQQVAFIEFQETVEFPEHQHGEQWEWVLAGRVVLHREGTSTEYLPGDNFFIPAGVPHGASVQAGYKALLIFNAPDRYRLKA
jgi:quercetin dioxygenase-like cupin family protein